MESRSKKFNNYAHFYGETITIMFWGHKMSSHQVIHILHAAHCTEREYTRICEVVVLDIIITCMTAQYHSAHCNLLIIITSTRILRDSSLSFCFGFGIWQSI